MKPSYGIIIYIIVYQIKGACLQSTQMVHVDKETGEVSEALYFEIPLVDLPPTPKIIASIN